MFAAIARAFGVEMERGASHRRPGRPAGPAWLTVLGGAFIALLLSVAPASALSLSGLSNFGQRLEQLHNAPTTAAKGIANRLSLQIGDREQPGPDQDPFRTWDQSFLPKFYANRGLEPQSGGLAKTALGLSGGHSRLAAPARSAGLTSANDNTADGTAPKAQPDTVEVWVGGAIDFGLHKGDPNRSKLKFSSSGISMGADKRFTDRLTLGAGFGYGEDLTKIGSDGSQNKAKAYSAAVYGSFHASEKVYVDGVLGYARLRFDTRRFAAAVPEYEFGKRTGEELFASLTAAYEYQTKLMLVSPYGRIQGVSGTLDGFTEHGGSGALVFGAQSLSSLKAAFGVKGEYLYVTPQGQWRPRLRAEYARELARSGTFGIQYADWLNGPIFAGALDDTRGQGRFSVGLGTDFQTRALTLSVDVKTDLSGSGPQTSQVTAKAAWKF